jgi:HSP20 family protein
MMFVDVIKDKLSPRPVFRVAPPKIDPGSVYADLWNQGPRRPGFEAFYHYLTGNGLAPCVDVRENGATLTVTVELPGVRAEDLQIHLSPQLNHLIIQGDKKSDTVDKEESCYRSERFFGSFHRNVQLPTMVDPDVVHAILEDGLLVITLTKDGTASDGYQRIPVRLNRPRSAQQ